MAPCFPQSVNVKGQLMTGTLKITNELPWTFPEFWHEEDLIYLSFEIFIAKLVHANVAQAE